MAQQFHYGEWTDHVHGNRQGLGIAGAALGLTAVAAALPVAESAPAALGPAVETACSASGSMLGAIASGLAQSVPVVGGVVAVSAIHGMSLDSLVIP